MAYPYFFRNSTSAGTAFFLLALLPALSNGAETDKAQNPMTMYFDDSQMVEVATRAPKPMAQVAENVSIITADEIAAIHAHTLGEILDRVAGMFVQFDGRDFLGMETMRISGTRRQHALFLLDGVRINQNSNGYAQLSFVPLGIIKRIEIIKGPASSSWGSALGGVVNIITKDTGTTPVPKATASASYGKANSREVSLDLAGGGEKVGYYLYGGNIDSDGLKLDRYGERNSAYGKLQVKLPNNSSLTAAGGYSDPNYKLLDWGNAWGISDLNVYDDVGTHNFWGTVYYDAELAQKLNLHLAIQRYKNEFMDDFRSLGTGNGGPNGDFIYRQNWDDEVNSFSSNLNWAGENLASNIGFESSRSKMVYSSATGVLFGGPSSSTDDPAQEERRGLYANTTYTHGKFSLTPGIRYDYNSNSQAFTSPSLGATYQLANDTLLRASAARGFSAPYLSAIQNSPGLKPETITAYQAGIETHRVPDLLLKLTAFLYNISDAWNMSSVPWVNAGHIRLHGVEFEATTNEYHGLTLTTNFTLASENSMGDGDTDRKNDATYTANLIADYRLREYGLRAELAGHYYWMNGDLINDNPICNTFLWDALLSKELALPLLQTEIFLKAHNIFNGSQYWDFAYPNPDRWVEAGAVFKF